MDQKTFDRLTRLVAASGSRRAAWRALLAAALIGTTTRRAAAAPTTPCDTGKHALCITPTGRECCPGRCFVDECQPENQVCCTAPKLIICTDVLSGKPICCQNQGDSPCDHCIRPDGTSPTCGGVITGSYRRR